MKWLFSFLLLSMLFCCSKEDVVVDSIERKATANGTLVSFTTAHISNSNPESPAFSWYNRIIQEKLKRPASVPPMRMNRCIEYSVVLSDSSRKTISSSIPIEEMDNFMLQFSHDFGKSLSDSTFDLLSWDPDAEIDRRVR